MRIAVVGGGPGGLYFASLWKRRHPTASVELFEQNPADATWGFGVVFSAQALEFLREDDPDTVDAIAPQMQSWSNITLSLHGEEIEIDQHPPGIRIVRRPIQSALKSKPRLHGPARTMRGERPPPGEPRRTRPRQLGLERAREGARRSQSVQ